MSEAMRLITEYIGKDNESRVIEGIIRKQEALGKSQQETARATRAAYEQQAEAAEAYRARLDKVGNALMGAGAATTAFAATGIRNAMNMEREIKSLEALTGSASAARKQFEYFDQRAGKSVFSLTEIVSAGKMMTAFGLETSKWLPIADDLAAGVNMRLEDTVRVMGRLKAGDFGEAFERLRDAGISRKDLEGEGLVFDRGGSYQGSVDKAMSAVEKIIKKRFGGLSETLATKTLAGAMSGLGDSWERFTRQVGNEGLEPATRGVRTLSGALDGLRANMGPTGATAILMAGPILTAGGAAVKAYGAFKTYTAIQTIAAYAQTQQALATDVQTAAIGRQNVALATGIGRWGTWGRLAAAGALGLGVGIAADAGINAMRGGQGKGSGADYATTIGGRALTGVAMGAPFGPVGMAAGAMLGGAVGFYEMGRGVYDERKHARKRGAEADALRMRLRREGKGGLRGHFEGGMTPREQLRAQSAAAMMSSNNYATAANAAPSIPQGAASAVSAAAMTTPQGAIRGGGTSILDAMNEYAIKAIEAAAAKQPEMGLDIRGASAVRQVPDMRRQVFGGGELARHGITPVELSGFVKSTGGGGFGGGGTQRYDVNLVGVSSFEEVIRRVVHAVNVGNAAQGDGKKGETEE